MLLIRLLVGTQRPQISHGHWGMPQDDTTGHLHANEQAGLQCEAGSTPNPQGVYFQCNGATGVNEQRPVHYPTVAPSCVEETQTSCNSYPPAVAHGTWSQPPTGYPAAQNTVLQLSCSNGYTPSTRGCTVSCSAMGFWQGCTSAQCVLSAPSGHTDVVNDNGGGGGVPPTASATADDSTSTSTYIIVVLVVALAGSVAFHVYDTNNGGKGMGPTIAKLKGLTSGGGDGLATGFISADKGGGMSGGTIYDMEGDSL